jgi:F-type H+-transporting ATPase subunit c
VDHTLIAQAGSIAVDPATLTKAAALIGAGIAAVGVVGSGIGIGVAGQGALSGMARQPEMATKLLVNTIIIAALMEALALFAFAIAIMLYMYGSAAPAAGTKTSAAQIYPLAYTPAEKTWSLN